MKDYGHWNITEELELDKWFGFVYVITHKDSGKKYIGKKQFNSYTRKKIKNRVNRKRVVKESNWRDYTGSNTELNEEIKKLGKDSFTFEILEYCKNKRELTYKEAWYQFNNNVLEDFFDDGNPKYYNSNILNKFFREKL